MGKSDEFDLADRVDDLICYFEGGNPDNDMDTIAILITGWIIFMLIAVALVKLAYAKIAQRLAKKKGTEKKQETSKTPTEAAKTDTSASKTVSPTTKSAFDSSPKEAAKVVDGGGGSKLGGISEGGEKPLELKSQGVRGQEGEAGKEAPGGDRGSVGSTIPPPRRNRKIESATLSESIDLSDKNKGPCLGPDAKVVDFVNQCHTWLHSPDTALHSQEWEAVKRQFISSVNKLLRDEAKKGVFLAAVTSVSVQEEMDVSNLFAECDHENSIRITCDCETKMMGGMDIRMRNSQDKSHHDFFVDRLCGRLSILVDCEEGLAVIKFDGWPEICTGMKNSLRDVNARLDPSVSEKIVENLNMAIRNAVLEIDLRSFSDFPTMPQVVPMKMPTTGNFLSLRVLKGIDIGLRKGCEHPYCAIELDDPPQKFQTDIQTGSNPFWDEEFVLNIIPGRGDILFEVFDNVGMKFMGCNILSLEEIKDESNHIIPLKSRRMEVSDGITGGIEVQFKFLEDTTTEAVKRHQSSAQAVKGNLIITKSAFRKPPISRRAEQHSPSTQPVTGQDEFSPLNPSDLNTNVRNNEALEGQGYPQRPAEHLDWQYGEERGRRKTRRGDIFTSIRRRFSKTRSSSSVHHDETQSDHESEPDYYHRKRKNRPKQDYSRSLSVDREHPGQPSLLSAGSGHLSTRSSASELSNFSGFSTSTYVHENSTLIIECTENGVKKYYLIPTALAETGKWKKQGKKLHIFNDHTFVAKQTPSGSVCEVCNGRFPFSLRKQAYVCRDCKLRCHKECHVRIVNFCPNTSIYDIELEYVTDGS